MGSTSRTRTGAAAACGDFASSADANRRACARKWARLDAPAGGCRALAERHLALKPLNATQYDSFKNLPERPARAW